MIAKFDGLEPRRCKDTKGIMAPEIDPKSFATFEKQALGDKFSQFSQRNLNPKSYLIPYLPTKQALKESACWDLWCNGRG